MKLNTRAIAAILFTLAMLTTPIGALAKTSHVTRVRETAQVGAIRVSWNLLRSNGYTYTITSEPTGKSCQVIDQSFCDIPVTDTTPWRFSVTASNGLTTTVPSAMTRSLIPHRVLIVAGQSNALGAESYAVDPVTMIDYFAAPYANKADSKSYLTWPAAWLVAQPQAGWVPLKTPQLLSFTSPPSHIFGPEVGLARQIWIDTGQSVSIVKFAYANTSLAIDWNPNSSNGIYAQLIANVRATMANDAAMGQFDVLSGIYWYQGESDAMDSTLYPSYQTNLTDLIANLHRDLPLAIATPVALAKESIAAVVAVKQANGLCPVDNCASLLAGDEVVRAADDWAVANIAGVTSVDTINLPRHGIQIHLSNVGELQLGSELASTTDHRFP
jgi:hypothetical protein